MSERQSEYVHGTAPDEQRRLSALNELLNATSLRQIAIRPGEYVLDVGSGLGQLTRDLARAAGRPALGIERSEEQIAEALRQAAAAGETALIELRQGDARALPLSEQEWGTFDLVHARFVLEHVPDPIEVVRQMARAVKPGGRVVLEDDDHEVLRLHPQPAGFAALWNAYMRTYDEVGNDPQVGRKLVALLHDAGLSPQRNTWLFFGACAGDAQFEGLVRNMLKLIGDQRERIVRARVLDAAAFDAALGVLRSWGDRRDAAIWFARCWAEGLK